MPELPDIVVYIDALDRLVGGRVLHKVRITGISLLRTYDPPISEAEGRTVQGFRRIGKRIVWDLGDELFMVLHLMVSGRLQWKDPGAAVPKKVGLAGFDFDEGTLVLTEAATRKRASLHLVSGEEALAAHDRGGIEPLDADSAEFTAALRRENHTLKRTLTDPRIFSGIGNAYSDEILHRAQLSPLRMSTKLSDEEAERLHGATVEVLTEWTELLAAEAGEFPSKVTAFRPKMAVHGKYKEPCPVCGSPVQRIVYASNETNYCATCQTGGKLLADRSLSRILKDDWPASIEELEEQST